MAIGYKLFRMKEGKLYPLYVLANKETPVGKWIEAECGEMSENGKVKSRLGELAYRAGWHLNDEVPYVSHIYSIHNGKKYLKDGCVWTEVEYADEVNYQEEANKNGMHKNGKFVPRDAYLRVIPKNGYYRYKTSPNMTGEWIISGSIRINRIMSDEEVYKMCIDAGYEPLKKYKKVVANG